VKSSDCWIGGQPPICEKLLEPYHLEEGDDAEVVEDDEADDTKDEK